MYWIRPLRTTAGIELRPGLNTLPKTILAYIVASTSLVVVAQGTAAREVREHIFAPGSTTFAASHASTVVELADGGIMAAWFGGSAEGRPDVAIWAARRQGAVWSAPVELVREPGVPCWNPVLFHAADGKLWLFYKFGPSPGTWTGAKRYSLDEGRTWSAVEHLPAGLLGPIRAKPLVLRDGTIVSGSSVESYHSWAVWIERSTDGGRTWAKIGPIVPSLDLNRDGPPGPAQTIPGASDWKYVEGIIQPSVVLLGGTHLRLYARSTEKTSRVAVADSFDDGLTWSQARTIDVPNPNSGIDVVALRDGRIVMIYNNTLAGRTPLNLGVSTDGEHFRMFLTLEQTPGEFSYPAIVQTAAGDLEMTYTWDRKTIEHVRLPLAAVPK